MSRTWVSRHLVPAAGVLGVLVLVIGLGGWPSNVVGNAAGLAGHPAAPADVSLTLVGRAGGPIRSVAAVGRYVLAAVGSQFVVFDVLLARRPRAVFESRMLAAQVEAVAVSGTFAFVAAGARGLVIYNIADPAAPVFAASLTTPGAARAVAVAGTYAYLATGATGLRIIDVSDVAAPVEVGFHDSAQFDVLDVAVKDVHAYVAAGPNGLHVLTVADPSAPIEVASVPLTGSAKGIAIDGNHAYVAAGSAGLRVVDISDPLQPLEVGYSRKGSPEDARDVTVDGPYAYVADRTVFAGEFPFLGGLRTVDITSPAFPVPVSNLAGDAWSVAVSGDRAYLASYDTLFGDASSLDVVAIGSLAQPERIGSFSIPANLAAPIVAKGSDLYALDSGLRRIGLSDPTRPHVAWNLRLPGDSYFPGELTGLAISGNHAFVGAGTAGLHVVDLQDPMRPAWVTTLDREAYGVAVDGPLAFISELYGGLSIVDITNPAIPAVLATITGNWSVSAMQGVGGYLYVAIDAYPDPSALVVYDISSPSQPVPVGLFYTGFNTPRHVEVAGRYAYLGVGTVDGAVVALDVSNPAAPRFVDRLGLPTYPADLTLSGTTAYVALPSIPGGVLAIDVSDPTGLRVIGQYDMSAAFALAVAAMPGGIVGVDSSEGLYVIRTAIAR